MRALRALGLLLLLSGVSGACSASRLPDYLASSPREYVHTSTQNDLTVAIHPLVSQAEIEKYFGTNLLARDILPVLIVAENRHASSSFIVRKQGIQLLNDGVQSVGADNERRLRSSGAATAVGITAAALIPVAIVVAVPLLLISGSMESQTQEIKRNFAMKEFQQAMIAPGETRSGFIYFQLPKIAESPDRWRLEIQALEPKEKAGLTYTYTFDWKRN